ncbi:hypothetical protein GCM10010404_27090 [Nonomuraea africana]|uniref:ATP-binding protein n=1 Tax=Nonomuraea africana TaxID=46171 RepID=A0ABR9KND5_9ACTN|nr:hypothetical protein [Nonomuraea africana]
MWFCQLASQAEMVSWTAAREPGSVSLMRITDHGLGVSGVEADRRSDSGEGDTRPGVSHHGT